MKAFVVLAAAGAAVAQNLSGVPTCAQPCLSTAITAVGCAPSDVACQCGPSQGAIGLAAAGCLIAACKADELGQAQSVGAALCAAFSATNTGSVSVTSVTSTSVATTSAPGGPTGSTTRPTTAATITTPTGSGTGAGAPTSTTSTRNAAATAAGGVLAAFLGVVMAL